MKLKKLLKKLRNRTTDESILAKIYEIERVLSPHEPEGAADPVFISPEVFMRLCYDGSINDIFSNCAMYVYGCDDSQADTKILAHNTNIGGHPFKELQLEVVESGTAMLFEIVSNDCWLCFVSGMISKSVRSGAPMLANNTTLISGDTFVVSAAQIVAY